MMRRLNGARLELRRALEEHDGSGELDKLTRLVLEAYTAIIATRREALSRDGGVGNAGGDIHAGNLRLVGDDVDRRARACPEQFSEGAA